MFNHNTAPIFNSLLKHKKKVKGNFHVPGHKKATAFDKKGLSWFKKILQIDFTEVGDLDDLYQATGCIKDALQLAADAFLAEHTFFLVGGTTAGILAAIFATTKKDNNLLIQRTSHQAVFNGCLLKGIHPYILTPKFNSKTYLELPLDVNYLEDVLKKNQKISAVLITSPSYYGVVQPLKDIAYCCHKQKIPLIVDEAHGAHFSFSKDLPPSAMEANADISIQSTHKTLTSMTMSSMLHLKSNYIKKEDIAYWLSIFQSSSPSYPLLASLDLTRRYMMTKGQKQLPKTLNFLKEFRKQITKLKFLKEVKSKYPTDPFKMLLTTKPFHLSGFTLAKLLQQWGCFVELADLDKVLFYFSLGTKLRELKYLSKILQKIDSLIPKLKKEQKIAPLSFESKELTSNSFKMFDVKNGEFVTLPLQKALGKITAKMLIPYPPGIPLILPGQLFTKNIITYIETFLFKGGIIKGLIDTKPATVLVIKEEV